MYLYGWTQGRPNGLIHLTGSPVEATTLAHLDPNLPMEIHPDACGYGIGTALVQRVDDKQVPIAFASRLMTCGKELPHNGAGMPRISVGTQEIQAADLRESNSGGHRPSRPLLAYHEKRTQRKAGQVGDVDAGVPAHDRPQEWQTAFGCRRLVKMPGRSGRRPHRR